MLNNTPKITFEQPMNEHVRLCLRLEHLFKQLDENLPIETEWGSRVALSAVLEILNVVDRPDLKTKLTKALSQHSAKLAQLEKSPQVDKEKLHELLKEIDRLNETLFNLPGKIGAALRENEFLNNIRQYTYNPGGACNFCLPSYQLWLRQPSPHRTQTLNAWIKHFVNIRETVFLLLNLIRNGAVSSQQIARDGFYQQALDPNNPCELVRVSLPENIGIYPEISVGRHRMSVRFLLENLHDRPKQLQNEITFDLNIC
ncbi:MAG: cell division protein ZapD [Gammaproteobacteria bacterium]|nr:cell division protein ZapD [Gammaproteobacteria bacterium]